MRTRLVLVSALTLCLAGCVAVPPAPVSTPSTASTVAPTPTATPTPDAQDPCGGLLDEATARAALGDTVTATDLAATTFAAAPFSFPPAYSVRSVGGVACEFSNGVPYAQSVGTSPDYVGVQIQALADAALGWERLQDKYQGQGGGTNCTTALGPVVCHSDALMESTWVSIYVQGAAEDAARALIASIEAGAAGFSGVEPVDRAGAAELPGCDGILAEETIESTLAGVDLYTDSPHGGWSLSSEAWLAFGGPRCFWMPETTSGFSMSLTTLPAGSWAWDERRDDLATPPEALALSGADESWLRCPTSETCTVDLVVDGNWIEFTVWTPGIVDRPGDLAAVGAAIIDRLA